MSDADRLRVSLSLLNTARLTITAAARTAHVCGRPYMAQRIYWYGALTHEVIDAIARIRIAHRSIRGRSASRL